MANAFGVILTRNEVVTPIDVLVEMERLTRKNVEDWRFGRSPYLERVFVGNLGKAARILRIIHLHAAASNLRPSQTVYCRWAKGRRNRLRFTKSGNPHLENANSTHFLSNPKSSRAKPASGTR